MVTDTIIYSLGFQSIWLAVFCYLSIRRNKNEQIRLISVIRKVKFINSSLRFISIEPNPNKNKPEGTLQNKSRIMTTWWEAALLSDNMND